MKRTMRNLTGKLRHFCQEWDGLEIDETCPEIVACTCTFSDYSRKQVRQIIGDAYKAAAGCDPLRREYLSH